MAVAKVLVARLALALMVVLEVVLFIRVQHHQVLPVKVTVAAREILRDNLVEVVEVEHLPPVVLVGIMGAMEALVLLLVFLAHL
jgi:hypothetical protein